MKPDKVRGDVDVDALWKPVDIGSYAPRSRLYSLPPFGAGTPLVESLPSYIMRLAHSHSVTVETLITREILP